MADSDPNKKPNPTFRILTNKEKENEQVLRPGYYVFPSLRSDYALEVRNITEPDKTKPGSDPEIGFPVRLTIYKPPKETVKFNFGTLSLKFKNDSTHPIFDGKIIIGSGPNTTFIVPGVADIVGEITPKIRRKSGEACIVYRHIGPESAIIRTTNIVTAQSKPLKLEKDMVVNVAEDLFGQVQTNPAELTFIVTDFNSNFNTLTIQRAVTDNNGRVAMPEIIILQAHQTLTFRNGEAVVADSSSQKWMTMFSALVDREEHGVIKFNEKDQCFEYHHKAKGISAQYHQKANRQ